MVGRAGAKSLYVIGEIVSYDEPTPIYAYDIGADGMLSFQAEYGAPFNGAGVVGLAINSLTEHLFVTYEASNKILTFDARTFTGRQINLAAAAENLAGIVYDHNRRLLYIVDRGTSDLYTYQWNAREEKLISVGGEAFTLQGASAYGIALDEVNDLLYVANLSREITVYNTWDWRRMQAIPTSRTAVSVAIDPTRGYLYYGAGYIDNYFLSQIDLVTGEENEVQIAEDAGVIGVGVDSTSGLVYVTTGRDNRSGGDDLLVFDTDLRVMQTLEDIGNPTGLVIPGEHTGYNPLNLRKIVKSPLNGQADSRELPRIAIGDTVTYVISFDREGYDLRDVSIVDRLPAEVAFVRATGEGRFGNYDPNTHTFRWADPPQVADTTNLELTCRLLPETTPGQAVVNLVTMITGVTPPSTTGVEAIATDVAYRPLNVRKTVLRAEGSRDDSVRPNYALPGDEITYHICIDNEDNEFTVGDISLTDRLPQEVTFIGAWEVDPSTGVMLDEWFGDYDPASHTYVASFDSLRPGEVRCIDLTVQLDDPLAAGTAITNTVEVVGNESGATNDSVEVIIGHQPLEMHKTIVDPVGEPDDRGRIRIEAGSEITYEIRFRNPSDTQTISQVVIVDTLPADVNFVTADGDGDYGSYDGKAHAYTWQYFAPVGPGEEVALLLVGRVDLDTEPNTVISNLAALTTRETPPSQARRDAVVVVTPVRGDMIVKPTRLFRDDTGPNQAVLVAIALPEGFGRGLIADLPLVFQPGNTRSTSMRIFGSTVQGRIMAVFDRAPILKATEDSGEFPVVVTGKLVDGRTFTARDTIWIGEFDTKK